jgi:hypothetical protein
MKNLLCIVIMVALLYLVWTTKEGFTSGKTPKDTAVKIQAANTALSDTLNIATYRTSYESMVNDLEKWTDQSMLNVLAEGKIGTDKPTEDIKLFNDLALFKKNITEFMDTLHKME